MSSETTVLPSSPRITVLIPCACLRTVSNVENSAISGGVDTRVKGNGLPNAEFRADQVGGPNRERSLSGMVPYCSKGHRMPL